MQLKSWSYKQFKKLAKKQANKLVESPCFVYKDNLDAGEEHFYLFSKDHKVLMRIVFHVAWEDPFIEIASPKHWKAGVMEDPYMYEGPFQYWYPVGGKV